MDSIVETQRQTHEELERYESALADVLMQNPTVVSQVTPCLVWSGLISSQQRNITRRDRKAADLLGRIDQLRKDLLSQYEDLPGLRPQELQLLSQPPAGEDELAEFYKRFEGVKDFHARNKNINTRQFVNDLDELVKGDGIQVVQVEDDDEPMIIERKFTSISFNDNADESSSGLGVLRRGSVREASRPLPLAYTVPQLEGIISFIILRIPGHVASRQSRTNIRPKGKIVTRIPRICPNTLHLSRFVL